MFTKTLSDLNWLCMLGVFLSGCASTFEPRLTSFDLNKPGLPGAKEVHAGVETSVEEFAAADKSRRAFDAEVAPRGVLPLLIRIENNSAANYVVQRHQIAVMVDGNPLAPLHAFEAADLGASRNGTWNALVNTAAVGPLAMFFWPATIAGSATQTQKINRQIEHHFESLELKDSVIKPGEKLAGFIFSRLPSSNSWDSATVEISLRRETGEEVETKPLNFQLRLSAPGSLRSDYVNSSAAP
jgi:hypothetical protein